MKTFCYETFLDPEGMTKADLTSCYRIIYGWKKIFNYKMLTLLIWKIAVTKILNVRSDLEISHSCVVETIVWVPVALSG